MKTNTWHKTKSRNIMLYNLLAKSINQVIIFSNKLFFHFCYEILNAPSAKIFCGTSAIFLHCFMCQTQVLMTVSRNHFLEGAFTFLGEGGGRGQKKSWDEREAPPPPPPPFLIS